MRAEFLELLVPSVCPICDAARRPGDPLLCGLACALEPLARLGSVATAFAYRGAGARLVQRLKFEGRSDALALAAGLLAERLATLRFDAIAPLPRHPRRVRELGRDPVFDLARLVARLLAVPLEPRALRRTRPTRPQTGLTPRERRANVAGSFAAGTFAARSRLGRGRLLVLDDVTTTGATLAAAAGALRAAGARRPLLAAAAGTPPEARLHRASPPAL